jgi:ribosomal protein S18 acetylase RimI-like enzyme
MFNRGTSRAEGAARCCVMPWNIAGASAAKNAWLKVEAENRRAIDFYLRHGFTRIGSTDFVIADQAYENYVMRTNLRQPVD